MNENEEDEGIPRQARLYGRNVIVLRLDPGMCEPGMWLGVVEYVWAKYNRGETGTRFMKCSR